MPFSQQIEISIVHVLKAKKELRKHSKKLAQKVFRRGEIVFSFVFPKKMLKNGQDAYGSKSQSAVCRIKS